ncbi:amino acid adenylation domain-containing protein [Tumebacillus sp. BK434]|uniref:non-ribosomal peptide synthetase n=1 Tax=Tumebacillus sp. BK434 TaxID=2512169 RepID=UPI001052FB1F|nr:non-ribosomal peptide synthetase [Tumebacillus sp. BK434]TCP59048.1 amino acid adenylation domain-containing protein [Tumebacillus sp. BK434]
MDHSKKSALSPEKRALLAKRIRGELANETFTGIPKRPSGQTAPLSFAQERMWFLEQFTPGTPMFNIPRMIRIDGPFQVEVLELSVNELLRRHEVLRTKFATIDGEPCQLIADEVTAAIRIHDLTCLSTAEQQAETVRLARAEAEQPFDLSQGSLLRITVLRLHEQEHKVLLTYHHIVSDGWSLGVTTGELAALYEAFAQGRPSPLGELPVQYADYAVWQREQMQRVLAKQLDYWKQQLGTPADPLELPLDKPRPAVSKHQGAICSEPIASELTTALRALCEREGVTLFMLLLSAFSVFLHRYTGQEDIRVGTPVAGRNRGEIEGLIGLFVNTLTMRAELGGNPAFHELLHAVRQTCLDAYAHQDLPFEKLVEELHVERSVSQTPLFQVMFAVHGTVDASIELSGLTWTPEDQPFAAAMFDLNVLFVERGSELSLDFEYSTELFEAATIQRMMKHFLNLLAGIAEDPAGRIGELPLLDAAEREQLLFGWNETSSDYPRDMAVHQVFERQAALTPNAVALAFEGETLTYRELNEQANRLARKLLQLGAGGQLVAVYMERSLELFASFLAVLKAGAAYVPLDVAYPQERLAYMLEDAQAAVLLTQTHLGDRIEWAGKEVPVLAVDGNEEDWAAFDPSDLQEPVTADFMAYMMYTSGSTGQPKGVCVPHRGIVRLVKGTEYLSFTPQDVHLQLAPVAFDGSTGEIWGALLNGGKLVVYPPHPVSLEELGRLVQEQGVTTLFLTSGLFTQMVDHSLESLRGLRQLVSGGDVMSAAHAQKVLERLSCRLVNVYGPTENTTITTAHDVTKSDDLRQGVPIGKPIANTTVYLLNEQLQPVPIGVPGQLLTGGDGVALGYWQLPELTVERFVEDPFAKGPGAYLYKTGDLARRRADGTLEFLGRRDQQVKLRGFRIEPGEIEACLHEHSDVQEALAMVREDRPGEKRLTAYVVWRGPRAEQDEAVKQELRAFLKARLPEHMLPSAYVLLAAMPLTANEKVDRRALPAPEEAGVGSQAAYVAPRTQTEAQLAAIFAALLGVEKVGVLDDFFDLGGHSLLATRLLTRIRTELGVELPMRELFAGLSTVEALARRWEDEQALPAGTVAVALPTIPLVPRGAAHPLSFSQQRLWFLDRLLTNRAAYNIPAAVKFSGALDVAVLAASFREIVRRHEALRTTFQLLDDAPVQVILEDVTTEFPIIDLSDLPAELRDCEVQRQIRLEAERPFDLSRDRLLRTTLLKLSPSEHVLVAVMHHIISDGWSVGVFTAELSALYRAFLQGEASPLPELAVQYVDFAAWQRTWLQGAVLEEQVAYWTKQLGGELPVLQLAADRSRPAQQSYTGAGVPVAISKRLTEGLKKLGKVEGSTLFMTLLAGFQALLFRHSGQEDIIVGSPIAGRRLAEVEGLIGFFTNTLAMRTDLSGDPTFRELLARVRQTAVDAYAHQDLPFERLVEELRVTRDLSHSPIFQSMLVLHNAPSAAVELPGVELSVMPNETTAVKFDLLLELQETEDGLSGVLEYSTDLFATASAERLVRDFERMIVGAVENAEQKVSEILLLTEADRAQLMSWSRGEEKELEELCVHQRFERQAAQTPDAVAVRFRDGQTTYRELNEQANRLAHRLAELGVTPGVRVALCLERSPEQVAAVLAVLKAGGCYVPLDPTHPEERLTYVLTQSEAEVVITTGSLLGSLPAHDVTVLCLDEEALAELPLDNLHSGVSLEADAYLLYTSGTTGVPKGVLMHHLPLANLIQWQLGAGAFAAGQRTLQYAALTFDVSFQELFSTLCTGGTLVLVENEVRIDAARLLRQLSAERVERMFLPFVAFQQLAEAFAADAAAELFLQEIYTAGDQLQMTPLIQHLLQKLPGCRLFNHYGPTESHVVTACEVVGAAEALPPIGRPIHNAEIYLLDAKGNLQGIGIPGELHIGGLSVARGYAGRPDLTEERFLATAFGRLYKTGDLARWLPDGNLEFLGRADDQVKIRGYRVELGEVESMLRQHPDVQDAAVLAREDAAGAKRLVAYVVAQAGADVSSAGLKTFLAASLPEYMVPLFFVFLDALPMNASRKVDRKALPAPELTTPDNQAAYLAPATPLEEKLAGLYEQVLGIGRVGVQDSFFELGGHSLLATRLLAKVLTELQAEVPVSILFQHPTVSGLAQWLEQQTPTLADSRLAPLRKRERDGEIPLSYSQQRIWFLDQLTPGSNAYNLPTALLFRGELDVEAVRRSFHEIVRRHETLRTTFEVRDEQMMQAVQQIAAEWELEIPLLDLTGCEDREAELHRIAGEEALRPFDLAHGPLLRVSLVRLAEQEHALLINMHHIISDGGSLRVLIEEFVALYGAFAQGLPSPLPERPVQFADYALWQREWMQGETLERQLAYWKTKLGGPLPALELPADRLADAGTGHSATSTVLLSQEMTIALKKLGREEGATPFMALLAVFKTLLFRLSGQEDIIVGTPVDNRGKAETEGMIGLLLNTLALRTDLSGAPTFRELLQRVRATTLASYEYQEVPFEKIVEEIQPERNLHRNPVFDVMINFINASLDELKLPGLTISGLEAGHEPASKFQLTFYISEQEEQLTLGFVYQKERFSAERMGAFLEQFQALLEQALVNADLAITEYTLLTDSARAVLPDPRAVIGEPSYPFVRDLFAKWAADAPEQTAVLQGDRVWSYAELQARSTELARMLVANGVRRGDAVAVAGTRSYGFVAAMLGVLCSGGVLVPVDLALPPDRQRVMVEQSGAQRVLSVSAEPMTEDWQAMFSSLELVVVDPQSGVAHASVVSDATPLPELAPDDPAYIFFTSGTTGVPKGVLGSHKGLNHFLAWQRDTFDIGPDDRVAQLIHLSFDAVLRDVFLPLTSGAALCLPDAGADLGGDVILPWLERNRVTVLHTVPSVGQAWTADHPAGITLRALRHLFLAGEPLTDVLVDRLRGAFPELGRIINLYGPTETTMVKCSYVVPERPMAGIQPVGLPFPETQALVLRENGQLAGIGESGEIVLRTPFATLGYINAPEAQQAFRPNPFRQHDPFDRLYFTGDKGRYRPDGALEILGRTDDQVKVRGVRIQLQEVAATLLRHAAVDACAVIDWQDESGQTALAAYSVLKPGQQASAVELRTHLEQHLPAAMVPGTYLFLDALPRLANGKVNRKALPKPERAGTEAEVYTAPRNALEEQLAGYFSEVLKVEQVGIYDHFFTLGGHSLLATQLIARIRRGLQIDLPLRLLFERPTIAALAEGIQQQRGLGQNAPPLLRSTGARETARAVSYAQQRLWFLDQLTPGSNAYNMPTALLLRGELDRAAVIASVQEIVCRHETLRTTFSVVGEQVMQVVAPELDLEVAALDLSGSEGRMEQLRRLAEEDALRPFDLRQGPLLRVSLVRLAAEEHALLVNMHHIISDGWSIGVLIREFTAIYGAFSQGLPSPLAELPIQFSDYADWQREWLQGETLARQLSYWKNKLGGELPVLELPMDRAEEGQGGGRSASCSVLLPSDLTHGLKELGLQQQATPYMTLLAVFQTLLSRLTGQEDIIVGTPFANRGQVETEGLIGLLLNTLAMRTDLSGTPTFRELLGRVRETVLEAYANQDVPFEKIVQEIQPDRNLNRNPVFDVMINFVNTPGSDAALPGLVISELVPEEERASKFLMTLYIAEQGEELLLNLVYQADLFAPQRMQVFMAQLEGLLRQVLADADRRLDAYTLLTARDHALLPDPAAALDSPVYPSVRELFVKWASDTPERTAVSQGERRWSYADLHERAHEIARELVASGVQQGDAVAVAGTRQYGLVAALLGVLFSGGVMVPVDMHLPLNRQKVMVEQSGAQRLLLVTEERMTEDWQAQFQSFDILQLDPHTGRIPHPTASVLTALPELSPDDPAYIFFTSGTTGLPKGVLGTHKGLNHFLDWQRSTFQIGPDDRVAQLIHLSFDAVLRDVFLPLTSGAVLCLPGAADHLGGDVVLPWLEREQITLVHTVPSVAQAWASDPPAGITLSSLRHLFLAGEPLSAALVGRLRGAFPELGDIINLYGPTETTMVKCYYVVPETPGAGIQPAGRPFPQTQALVLNAAGQLAGIGEGGEIVLRTPYRTLGYVNAPEENEKFAPNPFRPHDLADKLYFTGDKGRYRPDGSLEILGRADDQVKVRGVRIQLHEVAATLLQHPAVDACAVIDCKDDSGQTQLAAYCVLQAGADATPEDLRAYLERHLLAAMVPGVFLFLDELPRLANGKVDRKALPKPERTRGTAGTRVATRTPLEETLAAIYCEVLKLENVGVTDNFFSLGGHSLIATQLVSRVRLALGVELPLVSTFERPTVAALAEEIEQRMQQAPDAVAPGDAPIERKRRGSDEASRATPQPILPIPRAEGTVLPLSFAQQRLWFLDQLDPGSVAYNLPQAMQIGGPLDVPVLERALREIVSRHEALRTNFQTRDGQAVQVIAPTRSHVLPIVDLQQVSAEERDAVISDWAARELNTPFDLTCDALLRTTLLKCGAEEHVLLITMHHIISDGWSLGVFAGELMAIYTALRQEFPSPLGELAIQYADYAVWQREQLQGAKRAELLAYWKEQFAGEIPVLELPTDRPRPAVQNFAGDVVRFSLPSALQEALHALAQQEGATLYMTLLAAFTTLLSRYSGQEELVLGAPVAGRNRVETEPLIGFFVNTLAMRTDLSGNPSFRSLLQRVRGAALGAFAHQDLPLEMLIDELGIERDLSRSPLFQVTFLLQNAPGAESGQSGLTVAPLPSARTAAKFDLTLSMQESGQGLTGSFEFRTDLFDRATIERMALHFGQLLSFAAQNPDALLADLPLLTSEEERLILDEWSGAVAAFPDDTCLHTLFEAQAARTPDEPAVLFNEQTLTYCELNEKANQLAHRLVRQGVEQEQLIAILMERSVELIVAILAVQKAGGAYVPIDPSVPAERIAYMLEDSGAAVLLTQAHLLDALPAHRAEAIAVDAAWESIAVECGENLDLDLPPATLAYVIYTSGSTGRPKGVLIEHYGACNAVDQHRELLQIGTGRRMLQFASASFDASVMEIFTALTSGATLVLATQDQLMPGDGLAELIREREITDVTLTPAVLALLPEHDLPSLLTVVSAGEVCPAELAARWIGAGHTFINAYGPTEATIEATVSVNPDTSRAPDIGRPIPNASVYILDRSLRPVPIGVPGELYLGGPGVARGYLNRPDLTEQAFLPHPYHIDPDERLYRTGDRARWLPDGRIESLGRLDDQVKIRGFRIETGEIETALMRDPMVEKAVVVPHTDHLGQKRLAAYYVAAGGGAVSAQELRAALRQSLPDYMVPAVFHRLDALPLNASGKVDRRALPEPDVMGGAGRDFQPPQSGTEQTLATLWQELLGREEISRHDNFFEIGGHSLLATQLASRVREMFRVELPLRTLFEAPTIERLAERLEKMGPGVAIEPELTAFAAGATGAAPLSFSQQRLWFLDQWEPGSAAYNIANLVRLEGLLDLHVLEQSLALLTERHESLRTVFPARDGEPFQQVLAELTLPLVVTDLQGLANGEAQALQSAQAESRRPFDLAAGPLVRLHVYKLSDTEHLLLLLMHHIISDGWSMRVFLRELIALYDALQQGAPSPLAPLPVQYTGYSRWQRQRFQGEAMAKQLDYWKQQLGGELPILELPTDHPRPAAATGSGAKYAFALSAPLTAAVRQLSQEQGTTLYMTLLAAFQTLLARYTGQSDLLVGSPIAGRNRQEIEGLIGFFVNTLVLRTDLSGSPGFAELLQRVKRTTLDAYANQDVPFEMLVAELQPERDSGRTPLFQAMFALNHTPDTVQAVSGLMLSGLPLESGTAKFDMSLMMYETEDVLYAAFEYNADLWDEAAMARMSGHMLTLLEGMIADPEQPVGTLPLLTAAEARQVLLEWNETATEYPRESTVHELVEHFAATTPDAVALLFERTTVSYRELNEAANRLARRLQQLGVARGGLVGISIERSIEMIVAMVAILKAGAAFVPFDVTYPHDRLSYMFEDTQVGVLLTQAHLADRLPQHSATVLIVDSDLTVAEESSANLQLAVGKDDAAYVMYTSGSTGRPKGVVVPHRGIVRLVREVDYTDYTRDDVFLQFAPIAFDVSVLEIWGALLNGGRLAIFPPQQATLADLGDAIQTYGVTTLWITTGLFHSMVEHHPDGFQGVRQVLTGGDVLSVPHAQKALQHFDGSLFNAYGPTENTTFTTCHKVTAEAINQTVPIGRPVANTTVYVLDAKLQPVPVGVPGELYTGGDGLALGYLNRPELTAEKFVPNPFGEGKLYRTGDAVRWMSNGELEFIGRIDNQVKIRGFRVEIGEVEAALAQHPSVRDAVVVVRTEAGGKLLAAYVTAEPDTVLTSPDLSGFLQQTLPDYMIPTAFVVLDELPLNPNGKVDRKALAARALDFARETAFAAPQDRIELELLQLWREMLGHHALGVTDDFFKVGGHSLLAVRLIAQIEKRFGQKLPLSVLFRAGTVRRLAAQLRQGGQALPATPLVTIQSGLPGTAETPLFLVHPVGGSVFAYLDLARELGSDQPVYGLQARGLEDHRAPLVVMEEIAAEYVAAIRTVQQSGPYRLGGWSLGGSIVFAMAGQLRALGEEVELLVLIDARAPLADYQREMDDQELLLAFARDLAGQHGHQLEELAHAELSLREDALAALLALAREHQVFGSDLGLEDLQRLLNVFRSNYTAFNRYAALHRAERVLLIQAENAESDAYGWTELAEEVEVHRIGGNHFTLLQAPHVQELAGILKQHLQSIKLSR